MSEVLGNRACPRCQGFVAYSHQERFCMNCSWRPYETIPEYVRDSCMYCQKREVDLERSNLACRICLDKVNAIRQKQRLRNANYGRTVEEVRAGT